jgi:low-density lipoprotein receptor-related protein 1 (alpha-2-macroglobulin receptor)
MNYDILICILFAEAIIGGHDRKDEGCPADMFLCTDTRPYCINLEWKCDGTPDCNPPIDEQNCPSDSPFKCANDMFSCDNGNCVEHDHVCDGDNDCDDNSDEAFALCSPGARDSPTNVFSKCARHDFSCADGLQCIAVTWRCDGHPECDDGSDEENCTGICDQKKEWKCKAANSCIPKQLRCDGQLDCMDGSDEIGHRATKLCLC